MAASFTKHWEAFWRWQDAHPAVANVFRGQGESRPIIPRIGRAEYSYNAATERSLFNAFKRAARPFLQVEINSEWEWLALAQHHGAPTRLADWTTSSLVACWFAVTSYPFESDAVIFALRTDGANIELFDVAAERTASMAIYPDPLDVRDKVLLLETAPVTARITTQRGIFTLHGAPTTPLLIPKADRFRIPKAMRVPFQHRLLDLGIEASHIYPDMDGLCKTLDWRLRSGKGFSAFS